MKLGFGSNGGRIAPGTFNLRAWRWFWWLLAGATAFIVPVSAEVSVFMFPGGPTGEVQYNDRGIFDGTPYAIISTTTGRFDVLTPPVGSAASYASYCSSASHVGRILVSSSSTSGQWVFVCESAGNWVQQRGVGGTGPSSLEVFNSFDGTRSSPTATLSLSDAFRGTVTGSTYTFRINFSSVVSQSDLGSYLANSSATATYLQKSSATATYALIANVLSNSSATATYIQFSSATSIYLQKSSAAATYALIANVLSNSSATATYVQFSSAVANFLNFSSATATYLQKSSAAATYLPYASLTAGSNITLTPAGSNLTIDSSASGMSSGATYYIQNTSSLQDGATFYVSSGTASNLNSQKLSLSDNGTDEMIKMDRIVSGTQQALIGIYSNGSHVYDIGRGPAGIGFFDSSSNPLVYANSSGDWTAGRSLAFSGSFQPPWPLRVIADTTLTSSAYYVRAEPTVDITLTMPDINSLGGISHYQIDICKTNTTTNTVSFSGGTGDSISDGPPILSFQNHCVTFISSVTNVGTGNGTWFVAMISTQSGTGTTISGGGGGTTIWSKLNGASLDTAVSTINVVYPLTATSSPSGQVNLTVGTTEFLTQSSATATYLQNSSATVTYVQFSSAVANYLTLSSAPLVYLQNSSAAVTYAGINVTLSNSSATATYLQFSSATVTYLQKSSAAVTYLPYASLTAGANITLTPSGSNLTIAASGSGGGSGSPLEVFSLYSGVKSSPTLSIAVEEGLRSSVSGSTFSFHVDFSSVASLSNLTVLETSTHATATYLSFSSATATYLQNSSATATYIQISSSTNGTGQLVRLDGTGRLSSSLVALQKLGSPQYLNLQDFVNSASPGWKSGGSITDAGSAKVNVSSGTGFIRDLDNDVATNYFMMWAASSTIPIANNSTLYLGVSYNSGTPVVSTKTTDTWNLDTEWALGTVVNEAGKLYISTLPWVSADNNANIIERFESVALVSRDNRGGGLVLSNTGTRNVAVTAGTILARMNEFSISAIDTSASGTFDHYYRNGAGSWTVQRSSTAWNNTQYDDGSGTLASITALNYSSRWFYLMTDGSLALVYGQNNSTTLAAALNDGTPSTVPDRILKEGLLIGRFIIQASGATPTVTQSAFGTAFTAASVTNFSDLAGTADISAQTNLAVTAPVVLTGDTLSVDQNILLTAAAGATTYAPLAGFSARVNMSLTNPTTMFIAAGANAYGQAWATGSAMGFNGTISSPTAVVLLSTTNFQAQLQGGATTFVTYRSTITTDGVPEGSNLYFTSARVNGALTNPSTSFFGLSQGVSPSTGIIAGTLASGVKVSTSNHNATGTASATTFLRGDNTWSSPAGSGDAVLAATQTWSGANTYVGSSTFSGPILDGTLIAGTSSWILTSRGANTYPQWLPASGGASAATFNYTFNAAQANIPGVNSPYISNSTTTAAAGVFFDETSTQTVTWSTTLSPYNGGTLNADVIFLSSATSGTMNWSVYVECTTPFADGVSADTDSFGTINSTSVVVGATSLMANKATVALTNQDSCAAGDEVRFKLERTAGTLDTAVGKGRVRRLRIYE